ncbi:non-functional NADPH-dependent codeinone reductase 2-like [Pyrus ussuriensis x Pyrus communis]|uniref:Non-functional NADPH-dependent codeinone reductase 2-like n=1 Tax=Pyrus ussuriensis x Pyrus communis TaxID=2448454 RepID=A0A5N5GXP8_9ROSA|nr:non-functional NADPH-dependent codeinone reductase 2-like [Pyrus ussuriensis x Pyrus communis]
MQIYNVIGKNQTKRTSHHAPMNLGLEYLDLYLIHFPVSLKPGSEYPFNQEEEDLLPMDFRSIWETMEECLTKFIGVSNFSCKKLEILLSTAEIPPVVNQVEMNPVWQQKKLMEFCESKGIVITATFHWGELEHLGGQ